MSQPSCSLPSLLRLAVSTEVKWPLPAAHPHDLLVNWIVLDVEDAKGGEALLLSGASAAPQQVALAKQRGIVALIVLGDAPPASVVEAADLPVAHLASHTPLQEFNRQLLTILINQRTHLLERGINIHAELTQMAAEGVGAKGLVQRMAELSAHSVLLQDKRLDIMASSASPEIQTQWDDILSRLGALRSLPKELQDRNQAGQKITVISQSLNDTLVRLVTSINVGGKARGYLSLIGAREKLDMLDRVIVEQGATVCGLLMAGSKAVRETEKRAKSDLLGALLQGELSPRDIRLWQETLGLDLSLPHAALRFSWDSDDPPSQRRLETLLNTEISRLKAKAIVSVMESEIVCFCQGMPREIRPDDAITLGRSVLDRAILKYPDANPRCGISTPAKSLNVWRDAFRQAGQALEMAQRLAARQPLYYPDLSVYRLLLQIEHSSELEAFHKEILGPLLAYENGPELIRTLDAYFERNGNLKKTANALYIHRNTLIYRMERIQEITGLDLNNPETRLALQLTLRIHKMLGGRDS